MGEKQLFNILTRIVFKLMSAELAKLKILKEQLQDCLTDEQRLKLLEKEEKICATLKASPKLRGFVNRLALDRAVILHSLIAIDQNHLLSSAQDREDLLEGLLNDLVAVQKFYADRGGVVGYHYGMQLLLHEVQESNEEKREEYHPPPQYDIRSLTEQTCAHILQGIYSLPYIAELYPVGGAAERLHLVDSVTQAALPAAKLLFCGKTLLEGLIADVQAREYLYYKLFSVQITIPIAMMSSQEKDNHRQILAICEENAWFGRPKEAFQFFCQPAVPLIDKTGNWACSVDGKLLMKPGGHGVIWKLARDAGIFKQWKAQGIRKILVRQINNPIAGCDYGLLAFLGIGYSRDKAFGFASCQRQPLAAEGINILLVNKLDSTVRYCLTNIEYCDFKKRGVVDEVDPQAVNFSSFPSNTNILFADIEALDAAIAQCSLPGMVLNWKKTAMDTDSQTARLESTMQNIADYLVDYSDKDSLVNQEALCDKLKTFLTYNTRNKTISTAKRGYIAGGPLLETPEGCFYDMLQNAYELLNNFCHFELPTLNTAEEYLKEGPSFLFLYHPALGPLYSIIAQKIRKGKLALHSELQFEIAELDCEELSVEGSLRIQAMQILGERSAEGYIRYSQQAGKCTLKRVKINNRGIDRSIPQCYWKNQIVRKQLCEILIEGNGEFIAEDVTFYGDVHITVKAGERVRAVQKAQGIELIKEKISPPTWQWMYQLREGQIFCEIRPLA